MTVPDFTAQFTHKEPSGFVAWLEGKTTVFLLAARYRGRAVYYYLQLPTIRQQALKHKLKRGLPLRPSKEGTILACGYGTPSPTLQKHMEREFGVVVLAEKS